MNALRNHLFGSCRIAAALLLAAAAPAAMAVPGSIVGSTHDFTTGAYKGTNNPNNDICVYCHARQNTATGGSMVWNHAASSATYFPYSSPTMNATPSTAIGARSKVCLSCHDGTIAVDSYGTFTGTVKVTGPAVIGPDLSKDHPISFAYNTPLATFDGRLKDPTMANVTIGSGNTGTIATKMLFDGQLECSSCHDVHNTTSRTADSRKLVVMSMGASALCIACHNK